jgi:RNA-binding protein
MLQTPATSRSKSRKAKPSTAQDDAVPTAAPVLTKRRLQELKAEAHHLEPLVQIGHSGLHDAAFAAVTRALRDHELIKVRLHEPEDKRAMARQLADAVGAVMCGLVGHTVILFKPKPAKQKAAKREPARIAVPPRRSSRR